MDNLHTLVLTPWMTPHRICNWMDAICLLVDGKIDVLEEYEETVSSPSVTFAIPAVAVLRKPVRHFKKGVKFSRINILVRDRFSCCYCGKTLPPKQLNYDHVVPRAQGGKTIWENIVTSCIRCNSEKADRTPDQADMKLLRAPVKPKTLPMSQPFLDITRVPACWKPYLEGNNVSVA